MNGIEKVIESGTAREIWDVIASCEVESDWPTLAIEFAADWTGGGPTVAQKQEVWEALVEAAEMHHVRLVDQSHEPVLQDDFRGREEPREVAFSLYDAIWGSHGAFLPELDAKIAEVIGVLDRGGWWQDFIAGEYQDVDRRSRVIAEFDFVGQHASLLVDGRRFESGANRRMATVLADLADVGKLCGGILVAESIAGELA